MAIWICRAGRKSIYVEDFLKNSKIFCTWDGFKYDLNTIVDKEELKEKIRNDIKDANSTAVNTWTAQLFAFRDGMKKGDIVLTPNKNSVSYNIGIVCGDYFFDGNAPEHFYHGRKVRWIDRIVNREDFPKHIRYSLGAYRTIFRLKYDNEFMEIMDQLKISL